MIIDFSKTGGGPGERVIEIEEEEGGSENGSENYDSIVFTI